ncbi:winged helix-turn-helix domain-containing protein [Erythrobacter alti]|uniref:winged helix-turn-helix domain-containing protein n=1 Tax=Erythrobacter alti TaxID=1896145 RepID=UPI0030F42BD8
MNSDQETAKPSFYEGPLTVGEIVADTSLCTISANQVTVRLEPMVMDLLTAFIETPNAVLSRDNLINKVWSDRYGSDESLSRAVSLLRKSIRSCGVTDTYVETVPKRGYRLLQSVKPASTSAANGSAVPVGGNRFTTVTVVPFQLIGKEAISDIGPEIADGLSRFSWLRARVSTESRPDSRFRLEGRQLHSSGHIQISVRLIDQIEDAIIWSRSYEKLVTDEADVVLEIEGITQTIIASLGDPHGRLMAAVFSDFIGSDDNRPLTGPHAVVRTFLFKERVNAEDHLATRTALEKAREIDPTCADVWAASAYITIEEYKHEFNPLPNSANRALDMARKAIEIDPRNAYAQFCLAEVYFFRRDYGAFRSAGEKAIELNPFDSDAMAMIGIMMFYGGDWERGVQLTLRAMELNPDHPGWYRFAHIFNDVLDDNLHRALQWAERVQMPSYYADPYTRAIVLGLMGHTDKAQEAANEMIDLWGTDLTGFREKAVDRWTFRSPELAEKFALGLRNAGLHLPETSPGQGAQAV